MKKNLFIFSSITIFSLIIDYYTKFIALQHLKEENIIHITSYLNLVKVWNIGISFGMFRELIHADIIFSILSIIIVSFITIWQISQKNIIIPISTGMIVGGAIGNILDRIKYSAVFDFIDIFYSNIHYPAFNFADVFICIGALIIICYKFSGKKR